MTILVTIHVLLAACGALAAWLGRRLAAHGADTSRAVGGVADTIERRFAELETRVDRRLEGLDGRLLSTQRSAGDTATQIVERLGKLDGTAAQMLARATSHASSRRCARQRPAAASARSCSATSFATRCRRTRTGCSTASARASASMP